ncbi:hypothetical protein [Streptomyces sp. NPDC001480]|uniref:hypothetical protein n=1 Tax=Streptomyces sp. NPDC001480 TaxID=3364577 RepID=UPI0036BC3D31
MLFIDRLEPLLPAVPLEEVVLWHLPMGSSGAQLGDNYGTVGRAPGSDRWKYHSLGSFPLGDETPTWVYLIAFPDWHGERFVKIGIGLNQRVRTHQNRGGIVLQKVKVPRWQARVVERLVLQQYPRQSPHVPLPQGGDTECLVWEAGSKIQLSALARMTSGFKHESAQVFPDPEQLVSSGGVEGSTDLPPTATPNDSATSSA